MLVLRKGIAFVSFLCENKENHADLLPFQGGKNLMKHLPFKWHPNEPFFECFCFLEHEVFFIIKPQFGFIKLNKNKDFQHLERMKLLRRGMISSVNVFRSMALPSSVQQPVHNDS